MARGRHPYHRTASSPPTSGGPTISILPTTGSQLSRHHASPRSTGISLLDCGPGLASLAGMPVVGAAKRRKAWTFALLGLLVVSFLMFARRPHERYPPRHPQTYDYGPPQELEYDKKNPFKTRYSLPLVGGRRRQQEPLMESLMVFLRGGEQVVRDAAEEAGVRGGEDRKRSWIGGGGREWSWLQDRTVLMLGDSIDRYHLLHLCQFLQPSAPLHPLPWPDAKPSDYVTIYTPTSKGTAYDKKVAKIEEELAKTTRGGEAFGSEPSRVWTCAIDKRRGGLNALLVWGFLNGFDDGHTTPGVIPYPPPDDQPISSTHGLIGAPTWDKAQSMPYGDRAFWPIESPHFNPPLSSEDRYEQLFAPILRNLGRQKVDMVELGVGPWDLGMYRSQDTLSVERSALTQNTNSSYVDALSAKLSATPLSPARLAWLSSRLSSFHSYLAELYPNRLRVRGMHVTPQWYSYPWKFEEVRIRQVQEATKEVVGADSMKGGLSGWEEIVGGKGEWLDHIHPGPIPASWIWADMMLNDLKRMVTSR